MASPYTFRIKLCREEHHHPEAEQLVRLFYYSDKVEVVELFHIEEEEDQSHRFHASEEGEVVTVRLLFHASAGVEVEVVMCHTFCVQDVKNCRNNNLGSRTYQNIRLR